MSEQKEKYTIMEGYITENGDVTFDPNQSKRVIIMDLTDFTNLIARLRKMSVSPKDGGKQT